MTKPITNPADDVANPNEFGVRRPHLFWQILTIGGLTVLTALAASGPIYFWVSQKSGLDPGRWAVVSFVALMGALHTFQAYQAYVMARKLPAATMSLRRKNAMGWWLQTLLLGTASLHLLLKMKREHQVPKE